MALLLAVAAGCLLPCTAQRLRRWDYFALQQAPAPEAASQAPALPAEEEIVPPAPVPEAATVVEPPAVEVLPAAPSPSTPPPAPALEAETLPLPPGEEPFKLPFTPAPVATADACACTATGFSGGANTSGERGHGWGADVAVLVV